MLEYLQYAEELRVHFLWPVLVLWIGRCINRD
jgi:hypothetical protein